MVDITAAYTWAMLPPGEIAKIKTEIEQFEQLS
jgi:hypothetical protein